MDEKEYCQPASQEKTLVMKRAATWAAGFNTCINLGGVVPDPFRDSTFPELLSLLEASSASCPGGLAWVPYSDTGLEDRWMYPEDQGNNRRQQMPWIIAQPNGGVFENCAALEPAYSTRDQNGRSMVLVDIDCARKHCYFCRFSSRLHFRMRGLCKESQLDSSYTLVSQGEEFYWRGFTGKSLLVWRQEKRAWVASTLDPSRNTEAVYGGSKPHPLGQADWQVFNDTCGDGVQEVRVVSFTRCTSQQFACGNAECVDRQQRCDSKADCSDLTDEADCRMYELGGDYNRDKIPPALFGEEKVQVSRNFWARIES